MGGAGQTVGRTSSLRIPPASNKPTAFNPPDPVNAAAPRLATWLALVRRLDQEECHDPQTSTVAEFPGEELLDASVQHADTVHNPTDSLELRSRFKTLFHEGTPPIEAPHA